MALAYDFYFLPSWNHVISKQTSDTLQNFERIFHRKFCENFPVEGLWSEPVLLCADHFLLCFFLFYFCFFQQRYFIEYENDLPSNERKNCLGTRKGGPYPKKGMAYIIYLLHNRIH